MVAVQTKYPPARYGLGSEFSKSEVPIEFAGIFQNRFININGDAEKRQGISQLGSTITGSPNITGLHEFVAKDGTSTLFASALGTIYKYDDSAQTWSEILTGKDPDSRLISTQMGDKLIFVNGVDRNFYTDDAGDSFQELQSLIVRGQTSTSATDTTNLTDSNVESWTADTLVTNNDLVYNAELDAYGIVTSVGASQVAHTEISSSATGIGVSDTNQTNGQLYRIIDLVELNIIEQNNGLDNFATATSGTSTNQVRVSGLNFSDTDIRKGDYIYNTTRSAVTEVESVSANVTVTSVAAQTANDSVQFFKSAMPVADYMHVHFSRAYYIDSRDPSIVRISGPDDPQDMTSFPGTLKPNFQRYGDRQPQGEKLLQLKTFQKYLIAAGERNVYADAGVDPVQDTTAATTDFRPVGLFPQGAVSRYGMDSIGGTMIVASIDGIRNFAATFDSDTFQTANVSEAIKSQVAEAIEAKLTDTDEIIITHYPRRNWVLCKIGDVIYNYNYTPFYLNGEISSNLIGSWSTFTGLFAEQNMFYVRRNGDLVCGGDNGKVYEFDKDVFSDDGTAIQTIYETGFLTMTEPRESTHLKSGVYIKPQFESSSPITYNITAIGDYEEIVENTISVATEGVGEVGFAQVGTSPIGGNRIKNQKLPLRWKGEEFKIRITTNSTEGPDIITGFTIYGNILGKV